MIETYLSERETLRLVVLILDIRRDPSPEDRQLIGWLQFYRLPFLIVLTKIDKVSRNQLADRKRRIGEDLDLPSTIATDFVLRENRGGKGPPLAGDQKSDGDRSGRRCLIVGDERGIPLLRASDGPPSPVSRSFRLACFRLTLTQKSIYGIAQPPIDRDSPLRTICPQLQSTESEKGVKTGAERKR